MKKLTIKTISLPQFQGKTIQKVCNYVKKEYPNQLPLDGVDFYDNECLKDGNYHFFFGSVFRDSDGDWYVPCVQWGGSSFSRNGFWLDHDWLSSSRLVFLETTELDLGSSPALSLESLNLTVADHEKRLKKLEAKKNK